MCERLSPTNLVWRISEGLRTPVAQRTRRTEPLRITLDLRARVGNRKVPALRRLASKLQVQPARHWLGLAHGVKMRRSIHVSYPPFRIPEMLAGRIRTSRKLFFEVEPRCDPALGG